MIENKIIIRSVYKITRCFMEPARNPSTKRFADCVRPCDEHHKIILTERERSSGSIFISEEMSRDNYSFGFLYCGSV